MCFVCFDREIVERWSAKEREKKKWKMIIVVFCYKITLDFRQQLPQRYHIVHKNIINIIVASFLKTFQPNKSINNSIMFVIRYFARILLEHCPFCIELPAIAIANYVENFLGDNSFSSQKIYVTFFVLFCLYVKVKNPETRNDIKW